jgi:hypothetical protein
MNWFRWVVKVGFLNQHLAQRALDLAANHLKANHLFPLYEHGVVITPFVQACGYTTESVDMKLSLKGFELRLMKVTSHDSLCELFRLVNAKGHAMRLPGNDVLVAIIFRIQ